jgi:putative transposase
MPTTRFSGMRSLRRLRVHAYVWMTNHIHLLATPESENGISKVFQSVGRRYVQYFNYTYRRSGTLWEGRYRATVVDSERYLLTLMRYIELNPVRAGMVAHPRDYPWSSYRFNADGASGPNSDWLVPHPQYRLLGRNQEERRSAYRQLFRAAISTYFPHVGELFFRQFSEGCDVCVE